MAAKYKLFLRFVWIKLKEGEMFVSFLPLLRQKERGLFSLFCCYETSTTNYSFENGKNFPYFFFFHLFNVP